MANEVTNWLSLSLKQMWPIILGLIAVTVFLSNINTKLDNLIAIETQTQNEFKQWKIGLEDRVGKQSVRISIIETQHGLLFSNIK